MNTFQFLNGQSINSSTFVSDVASIRSRLYEHGVCWTDSVQGRFSPVEPFRVILYTRRDNVDFKNPMVKECNGLVFEYFNGWKLLAMPQHAFCTNKISMRKLIDLHNAGGYDVYEVLDATILTLYFYNNEWRIASTKGYDIGSMEMVTGMTFMQAIYDLIATKYKAFKFEDLSKGYSYTIALRHSKYHIFDETRHLPDRNKSVMNSYLMVMAIADLSTFSFISKHIPGLPTQNPLSLREHNVSSLLNYARSAFAKYSKAHQLQNFKYKPLYGYILRAKNRSIPSEYSTIFIESELYKIIKSALYKNNNSLRTCDYNSLVIQMAMSHERYDQYRILFRQFEPKFAQLKTSIDRVASTVIKRIVKQNGTESSGDTEDIDLVDQLVEQFKSEPDATPGLIKDAIYNKCHHPSLNMLVT